MNFKENEIIEIYNKKVKKPKEYFNLSIPKNCPVKKWNNNWRWKDAPRCACVRDFINWIEKYDLKKCKSLGYTSEHDPELEFLDPEKKTLYLYDKVDDITKKKNNDLHTFVALEKHDFFLFNQTLEHVYNPYMVVENINKNLVKGGYVFTSVPTINIPHDTPFNFSMWYPMGLAILFKSAGFEIIEMGQWGNIRYITKIFTTHGWPDIYQCGDNNEEKNVAQCWILAKKL